MNKKVLLTGSSGFLGSQLTKDLVFNNFIVTALDINDPIKKFDGVQYVKSDLKKYLNNTNLLNEFELIIHAASVLPYKNARKRFGIKIFIQQKN